MIAAEQRISEVLEDARNRFFAGQVTDSEALHRAIDLGLVRYFYDSGLSAFLSLAKLELTDAGRAALSIPATDGEPS